MSVHTPGPWTVGTGIDHEGKPMGGAKTCIHTADGLWIAEAYHGGIGLPAEANARLMAAAPELLERLERCHRFLANGQWSEEAEELCESVDAAIARAKP